MGTESGDGDIPETGLRWNQIKFPSVLSIHDYQKLYYELSDPVGLIGVAQAVGQVSPSERARSYFHERYMERSMEQEFKTKSSSTKDKTERDTLKMRTGPGNTANIMKSSRDGESALLMLSFLLYVFESKMVTEIIDCIVRVAPLAVIPIQPTTDQIDALVESIETQVSTVNWYNQIRESEKAVHEKSHRNKMDKITLKDHDPAPEDIARFYRFVSQVSRFPEYSCELETNQSIVFFFALTHVICGLNVCVMVNGECLMGSNVQGEYQVLLKRDDHSEHLGKATLVFKVEKVEDLFMLTRQGPMRANRTGLRGIGKRYTMDQGITEREASDLAVVALMVVNYVLMRLKRDIHRGRNSVSAPQPTKERPRFEESRPSAPVNTRLSISAVSFWWDCDPPRALQLAKAAEFLLQDERGNTVLSWDNLTYGNQIVAKTAGFQDLSDEEQRRLRKISNGPQTRGDYGRLVHTLVAQLLLIAFLGSSERSFDDIHVRNRVDPRETTLGRIIDQIDDIQGLGVDDIMYSWYNWIKGSLPSKDWENVDAFTADGFNIYRSMLTDINLEPAASELVIVEPGYITYDSQRRSAIQGKKANDAGSEVRGMAVSKVRTGPDARYKAQFVSEDRTGEVDYHFAVDVQDKMTVQVSLTLKGNPRPSAQDISILTSIHDIAQRSWSLHYDDIADTCDHGVEKSDYQTVEFIESTPGKRDPRYKSISKELQLFREAGLIIYKAYRNPIGQVACLMSTKEDEFGLLKRSACQWCSIKQCMNASCNFLID